MKTAILIPAYKPEKTLFLPFLKELSESFENIVIINDGSGYFRPGEDDEAAFEEYAAKERHRAREVLRKISRMEEAFNRRYQ